MTAQPSPESPPRSWRADPRVWVVVVALLLLSLELGLWSAGYGAVATTYTSARYGWRKYPNVELIEEPFATLPICATGERGLLGIAVDPKFSENHHLYVFHSRSPELQRITRFTARGNLGLEATVIFDGIPAGSYHNGGGLAFGPDGMLYFSVGDVGEGETAHNFRRR